VPRVSAVALFVLAASLLRAQSTNASLTGRVADPSKALIADVKIAAISAGTNLRYEATTNGSGEYYLANLPPGPYRIEIEKPGFKKLIKPDVLLHVQDALKIDFEMALGASSEAVTVEAGAPLVNTESATVSTVVDRTFVENLPLNGRSFQTLIMLTPGVVVTATAFDDQGQFSVNGQRADANYFTVDGVSANFGVTGFLLVQSASGALPALSASGGTNSLVSVDAMQEFRVQTSSFAPEFGRTPGGQISVVTRSGTNDFHGTLFEYFRNSVLDARDWFVNFNGLAKPEERQNDFGGVFGGPVRKNKTFFFFSYEGLRLRQPSTQETAVPDAVSRQQAPASMRPYLNAYPVANGAELGAGLAQFNASYSNPSSLDATSIRVDQAISPKVSLFARYNYSPSDVIQRGPLIGSTSVLSMTRSFPSSVQTLTAGLTQLITPGISNELRANYSNQRVGITNALGNFGGAVPLPDSVLFPPGYSSANSLFEMYLLGAGEIVQGKQAISEQRQVNVVDNLSVTKGAHQLKFGVDYRWLAPFTSPFSYSQFVEFTGVTTSPGGALSGTAAFAQANAYEASALLSKNFSLYGQDTWKITPRFTLTYGLRWDVNPPLKGKNSANDPFTVTGLTNPTTLALAPRGTPVYQTTYGNVAPRLGLAWQLGGRPNWDATLRAGFGVFYDLGQGSLGGVASYFPYITSKTISPSPVPFPLSPQDAAPPAISINPPVNSILVADPHLNLPRSYQWNIALEQSLGSSQSLSLTYIGAIGRDLLRATNLSNPNPNFQFVSVTDNSATSDYHALQIKFQRRLSGGLQALGSYTFSHSIDSASTDAIANYLNSPASFANPNIDRGDSDFDIRHAFTAGVTYNLPSVGSNQVVHSVLSGWSLDGFVLARSAPPDDIVSGIFFAAGTALYPRPNVNPGVPLELDGAGYPGGKIFNKVAFATPTAGQQGKFGRNVLRGFDAVQADISVQRQLRLTEKIGLRFRAEFFNILNHPNFANPTNSLPSPLFGRSTQTLANGLGSGGANGGFNPLYQIGGPRSAQLALKVQF
jgi:hypothetical protein